MTDRLEKIRSRVLTEPPPDDPAWWGIIVESLVATTSEPTIIRKAKATAHYFRRRGLVIHPGELIVGSKAPSPAHPRLDAAAQAAVVPPELPWVPPPPLSQTYLDTGMMITCGNHQTIDFETILAVGFRGLLDKIEARLSALPDDRRDERDFLAALQIIAEGYIDFCRHYAELADSEAACCADPVRHRELSAIASNCRRVIEFPPRTFWEACQAAWFAFFFLPDSPGRVDKYLTPFFRRDIESGTLTPAFAKELLGCLWAKYYGVFGPAERRTANNHLVLGGTDADGRDATSELSWLCLEVTQEMALPRPQVGIRWHKEMPRDFLERAVAVLRSGNGSPDFCNDEQIVPALIRVGVAPADARDFSLSGCHEVILSGKSQMGSVEGMFNAPKILRTALGLEPNVARGAVNVASLDSYDKLWAAVVDAMRDTVAALHEFAEYLDNGRAVDAAGWLEASLVTQGCIESGRGILRGGATYNYCNWNAIGIPNLADALYAIRRVVFEERMLTLPELVEVLRNNWAGHESLRQFILVRTAHFGNDNDDVDAIAAEIIRTLDELLATRTPFRGGRYTLGTLCGYENAHIVFGSGTLATPDGRHAGEPFASSLGAAPGCDRCGVTAMLNSVAKLPHRLLPTATTMNVMLDRALLDSNAGPTRIAALIEGHFRAGGQQFQFTFAGRDLLLRAKADPSMHENIMVRVAGYSAPFVSLEEALQDEIVQRTEHLL